MIHFLFTRFHPACRAAAGEAGDDRVASGKLSRVADDPAVGGALRQAVAPP